MAEANEAGRSTNRRAHGVLPPGPTAQRRPTGPAGMVPLYRIHLAYRLSSRVCSVALRGGRLAAPAMAKAALWVAVDVTQARWLQRRWRDPAPEPWLWEAAASTREPAAAPSPPEPPPSPPAPAPAPAPPGAAPSPPEPPPGPPAAAPRPLGLEPSTWLRLAVDTVDATLNREATASGQTRTSDVGIAMSIELGMRHGPGRGLAVPAWLLAVSRARRRGRQPIHPSLYAWNALGALGGWAVAIHERVVARRLLAAEQRRAEARAQRAFWAGRASVALGADTVVDVLSRTVPLIEPDGSALPEGAAAWRAKLVDDGREQGQFLGEVLSGWATNHNRALHDLTALVDLRYDADTGTTLLSPDQAGQLTTALAALAPRGDVEVAVLGAAAQRSAAELTVCVGGHQIALADPAVRQPPRYDASAFAFALQAIWCGADALPGFSHVPVRVAAPQVLAALAGVPTMEWLRRRARAAGTDLDPFPAVVGGLCIGAIHGVRSHRAVRRHVTAEGFQGMPSITAIWAPIGLASLHAGRLSAPRRAAIAAVAAATIVSGTAADPRRLDPKHLVAMGTFLAMAVYMPWRADERVRGQVSRQVAEVVEAYHDERASFAAGRESVLSFVRSELARLGDLLDERTDQLDPELCDAATQRLEEVRLRLGDLEARGESGPGSGPGVERAHELA